MTMTLIVMLMMMTPLHSRTPCYITSMKCTMDQELQYVAAQMLRALLTYVHTSF